jgi:hypothetical protein
MGRLEGYRTALLAAIPEVPASALENALEAAGPSFAAFIIDHGLGPLWHSRTERQEFRESRLSAEALYLAQDHAIKEIDEVLNLAGIDYAFIKGAANRTLLYENPAIRASWDLDLLVRSKDRVAVATAMVGAGYRIDAKARNISREITLSRGTVDIDLHWGLLREGRLRSDLVDVMLDRRRKAREMWMLNAEDAFFLLLVHPAFAKHLAGWGMGLHRVMDIMIWARMQVFDWHAVCAQLEQCGVRTAAWATLRWMELISPPNGTERVGIMLSDLSPGSMRRTYLDHWLRNDLTGRMSGIHIARLFGFTALLHDTLHDSARAFAGWRQAMKRSEADLRAFQGLLD